MSDLREALAGAQRRKKEALRRLRGTSDRYLAEVYGGVADGSSIREIHKAIRRVTKSDTGLGHPYSRELERYAMALASKAKRRVGAGPLLTGAALAGAAADFLSRERAFEETLSISLRKAREMEGRWKAEILIDWINEEPMEPMEPKAPEAPGAPGGAEPPKPQKPQKPPAGPGKTTWGSDFLDARIFYICSWHADSAEDHKDWQGRVYYDERWARKITGKAERDAVKREISRRGMRPIQWVIGRPVWLVTRPNCRHFFERASVKDVLFFPGSDISLARSRGLASEEGERDSGQTLYHPTGKSWYTEENVRRIIDRYRSRLEFHKELQRRRPCKRLEDYIEKDRALIRKWQRYLRDNF